MKTIFHMSESHPASGTAHGIGTVDNVRLLPLKAQQAIAKELPDAKRSWCVPIPDAPGLELVVRLETRLEPGDWSFVAYSTKDRDTQAVFLAWDTIEKFLGREHDGSGDDDDLLIQALDAAHAPEWIWDAEIYMDESGWYLIQPD